AHPFIPFITEEIFQQSSIFSHQGKNWLANSSWPECGVYGFEGSKTQVERVIAAIELVRSTRVELGIKPSAQIPATIEVQDKSLDYSGLWPVLSRLARIDIKSAKEQLDTRALALVGDGMTIYLRVENFLDFSEEVIKLSKEINDIEGKINSLKKKLANASFVEKAPQDVVSAERQRLIDLTQRNNELMDARQRMEDLSARQ
ncbi:MAG: class I tRNA ligase family protein, partial [Alphaproteobacteria bacterium]